MSASGSALPNRTPPTVTAAFGAGSMARSIRIAPDHALPRGRGQRRADRSHTSPEYSWRLHQPALLDGRLDEGGEQRVRLERAGFQLRVELHPDEPRMILVLDDLRQDAVGRHAGEPHAALLEPALVIGIDFVAVAVALRNLGFSIDRGDMASRLQARRVGAEPHG